MISCGTLAFLPFFGYPRERLNMRERENIEVIIMTTFNEAIRYPWSGGTRYFYFLIPLLAVLVWIGLTALIGIGIHWAAGIIAGILLFAVPVLAGLAFSGYVLRVLQALTKKDHTVPSWGSTKENLINGLKVLLVTFVWGAVLQVAAIVLGFIPALGGLLAFVLSLFGGLVIVILLFQMAEKYELGAGFDVGKAVRFVIDNLGAMLLAMFKSLLISLIYFIPELIFLGIGLVSFVGVFFRGAMTGMVGPGMFSGVGSLGAILLGIGFLLTVFFQYAGRLAGYRLYADVYVKN